MNTDVFPTECVDMELPEESSSGSPETETSISEGLTGILFVDPLPAFGDLLARHFRKVMAPRTVCSRTSVGSAARRIEKSQNFLIVTSPNLIDGTFYDLLRAVKSDSPSTRIVLWGDRVSRLIPNDDLEAVLPRALSLEGLESRLQEILNESKDPQIHETAEEPTEENGVVTSLRVSSQLSRRQLEVLILIAEGLTVRQISKRMNLSVKSVDSLKYRMMKKLNLHDRVALVRLAVREGLIDP